MKIKEVEEIFSEYYISRKKDGSFVLKKSYFYRHGMTTQKLADTILTRIPQAKIIGRGDHWHPFVGGAKTGSAKDSYMWVQFTVGEKREK